MEIPDFNDMEKVAKEILNLAVEKGKLYLKIQEQEANIVRETTTNEKYFIRGKPPSMSYIESTWKFTGFSNELVMTRDKLVEVSATLDYKKLWLELMKIKLDVWRTQSANERIAVG